MEFTQEKIYELKEANEFFKRTPKKLLPQKGQIRESKKEILSILKSQLGENLNSINALEIGCFVGDLLAKLKKNYKCNVIGIEPSSLAVEYAKEKFNLEIINSTFNNSKYYQLLDENQSAFDLIILDDVLSWFSRNIILASIGSIDWLLKPNGYLFIRDFSPSFEFAYPNHHQPNQDVYNYKVSGGHKSLFIASGMYLIDYELTRTDKKYQNVDTVRPDSSIWSDTLLKKAKTPLFPRLQLKRN